MIFFDMRYAICLIIQV